MQECRAIVDMLHEAAPHQREFVAGEVAGELHLSSVTAMRRVETAVSLRSHPRLAAALE